MTRIKHSWNVTLQRDDGEVIERPVHAFWDPDRDDTPDHIGIAAKAEAHMASGKRHEFAVIAVARG